MIYDDTFVFADLIFLCSLLKDILAGISQLTKRHLAFRIIHRSDAKNELERYMLLIESFQATFVVGSTLPRLILSM